jgi:hypothetical protein
LRASVCQEPASGGSWATSESPAMPISLSGREHHSARDWVMVMTHHAPAATVYGVHGATMFPQVLALAQVRIIGAGLSLTLGLFGSTVWPGRPHHASGGRPALTHPIEHDSVSCKRAWTRGRGVPAGHYRRWLSRPRHGRATPLLKQRRGLGNPGPLSGPDQAPARPGLDEALVNHRQPAQRLLEFRLLAHTPPCASGRRRATVHLMSRRASST